MGNRPLPDTTAAGKLAGAHPNAGVPVRVGVPPSKAAALAVLDEPELSCSRSPATTSTLPLMPLGSFGVFTGRATRAPDFVL